MNGLKNGKGKEYQYNNNKIIIIFDGEYLKGKKWNGKGYFCKGEENKNNINVIYELKKGKGLIKEYYDNGKLKFEGEYLNGEKNGKGKKYYENGKLKFKGEYLNNKKWNVKFYHNKVKKIFELKDGKGKIKKFYEGGKRKFEGEYLNGLKNGKGKEYYTNGKLKFDGIYLNGLKNGEGKEYNNNEKLIFEGVYKDGMEKNIMIMVN